jgi:glycosyltransferase involved in cell wall biosynthesis
VAPASAGLAATEVLDGVRVHRFRYAPRRWETLAYTGTMAETVAQSFAGKAALAGYLLAQGWAARRVVRQLAAPVVHAHWWFPAGLVATRVPLPPSRSLVVTMHGSDVRLAAQRPWAHAMFRSVLHRADVVTAVSRWLADRAHSLTPGVRPVVSPMPVNTALFAPPSRHGRERDELLFVGRLNEQKGLRLLLDALAAMQRHARLGVVGEGPDAAALRAQATTLGVADRVTWHGALEQQKLAALYQRATAVVIPALDEGLGLVAVEAQLCETPVVGFDSGGLADVIVHDESGLLVAPGDSAGLARALDRLLTDSQLAGALGTVGRVRALEVFSPDAVAGRYADMYRRLVGHAAA